MESVVWPSRLLDTVRMHLAAVEDPVTPSIPPICTSSVNVYDFFSEFGVSIQERMSACGFDDDVAGYCMNFVLEVLEHCCPLSFLFTRERRVVSNAARMRQKRVLSLKPGVKRRKVEVSDPSAAYLFSPVLTLEYLLRFFIAMPFLLEHYDRLGGAVLPSDCKRPLWTFVSITLELIDTSPDRLCPLSSYVPLR